MKNSIKRSYVNRRAARPFSKSEALHITMRSRVAVGDRLLLSKRNRDWLKTYLPNVARRFTVRVYSYSNNGNHLHLVLKTTDRENLSNFFRVLSGVIARRVLRTEKGRKLGVTFWDSRPFSRIISWGREFWNVMRYMERSKLEASGTLSYRKRSERDDRATRSYLDGLAYLNQRDVRTTSTE